MNYKLIENSTCSNTVLSAKARCVRVYVLCVCTVLFMSISVYCMNIYIRENYIFWRNSPLFTIFVVLLSTILPLDVILNVINLNWNKGNNEMLRLNGCMNSRWTRNFKSVTYTFDKRVKFNMVTQKHFLIKIFSLQKWTLNLNQILKKYIDAKFG